MLCYIRMKIIFLQGLLWLYLSGLGLMALSLEPGFLDFDNLPDTNFSCVGKVIGGYYADLETNCQMFHVCTIGQLEEPMDIRFLCLNGTVFDQETRVCERIDEVDCSKSEHFYSLNLELYGNSQPAILEEAPETEPPTTTSTTTTTTTTTVRPTKAKTTRITYYSTASPHSATTINKPQVIPARHHFPVVNSPDIRFNPEEINISLNPGAPPNIRTKPVSFQQHSFSDNNKSNNNIIVTTHTSTYKNEEPIVQVNNRGTERSVSQKPKTVVSYELTHENKNSHSVTPSDINYGFTYHPTPNTKEYPPPPRHHYNFPSNIPNFRPTFSAGNFNNQNRQYGSYRSNITPTTKINYVPKNTPTTIKTIFVQTYKPPPQFSFNHNNQQHHQNNQHHTEKPHRQQLILPLLPTPPAITFSTPSPFALPHHVETKRYTKDHQAPPRIIISASASISDASGRRLNLGTIDPAHILEQPPQSYDEYKDDDVSLDPFYHDVPKLKQRRRRRRRSAEIKHSDVIKNEQEAVDVLKFLFDWYKNHEKSSTTITIPVSPHVITEINEELAPSIETPLVTQESQLDESKDQTDDFKNSDLFKINKFSIVGDALDKEHSTEDLKYVAERKDEEDAVGIGYIFNPAYKEPEPSNATKDEKHQNEDGYVNDNYEAITYNETDQLQVQQDNKTEEDIISIPEYVDDNYEPIVYKESNSTYEVPKEETIKEDLITEEKKSEFNVEEALKENEEVDTEAPVDLIRENKNQEEKSLDLLIDEKHKTETISLPQPVEEKEINLNNSYGLPETNKEIHEELFKTDFNHTEEKPTSSEDKNEIHVKIPDPISSTTERIPDLPSPSQETSTISSKEIYTPYTIELTTVPTTSTSEFEINTPSTTTTTEKVTMRRRPTTTTTTTTTTRNNKRRGRGRSRFLTVAPTHTTPTNFYEALLSSSSTTVAPTPVNLYHLYSTSTSRTTTSTTESVLLQVEKNIDVEKNSSALSYFEKENATFINVDLKDDLGTTQTAPSPTTLEPVVITEASSTEPITEIVTVAAPTETIPTTKIVELSTTSKIVEPSTTTASIEVLIKNVELTTKSVVVEPIKETTTEKIEETTIPLFTTENFTSHDEEIETPTTSKPISSTVRSYHTRRTRPTRPTVQTSTSRRNIQRRKNVRHRFSTELFTSKPEPEPRLKIEDEIINALTRLFSEEENNATLIETATSSSVPLREDFSTNAPLYQSVHPTQAEHVIKEAIPTTPLSAVFKEEKYKHFYRFNCFGKNINKFYPDPRDCRLFHYCTQGYNKNQLLDMKFVCDFSTYFDDEKLICTKKKPIRCL